MKFKELYQKLRAQLYFELETFARSYQSAWTTMSPLERDKLVDQRINEMTNTELLERLGQLEEMP